MSVTTDFSGIVLNQNATATALLNWRSAPFSAQTIYQSFYLPPNYQEGTTAIEQRFPDLSGFQVFVNVDKGYAQSATLDYTLDWYVIGAGWTNLITGTAIGCHADGNVWFDVIFPNSIPVDANLASSLMRIGITGRTATKTTLNAKVTTNPDGTYVVNGIGVSATLIEDVPMPVTVNQDRGYLLLADGVVTYSIQQGVGGLWYVNPTPLSPPTCEAYLKNTSTPLFTGSQVALNFRILGLTADHGIDFLGNEYRSCVIQNSGSSNSLNHASVTSTQSVAWTSLPQPSPFAVVSQYFDVRPGPASPGYSGLNLNLNGSYEHDALGTIPYGYTFASGVSPSVFMVENGWSAFGANAVRYTATLTGGNLTSYAQTGMLSVSQGQAYNLAATVNVLALASGASAQVSVLWYTSAGALISTSGPYGVAPNTLGIRTISSIITAPATASNAVIQIGFSGSNAGFCDMYFDGILFGTGATIYFDGDTPGDVWMAQPGRSGSAIPTPAVARNNTVVLDGVLINPTTPNVNLNVYYSIDDSYTHPNMNETDWERKLWVRVPEVYVLTAQQQCMFPTPIHAKYIQLEYTNPQAQAYNPGTFNQPVSYKKYPTWVAEYFIAQLESPSFLAQGVSVQNDALNFAYAYYLDDLAEAPSDPIPAPPDSVTTLTNYFNQNNMANLVDTSTLAQINFVMQQFQLPTGALLGGANTSLIQQYASNIVNANQLAPTSENTFLAPVDYSTVSSLAREAIVLEQTQPAMFFFLTCRHAYKEISTSFEFNRAYFVGIQDVSFLRANYATASDGVQYIESGGDTTNAVLMDFNVDSDLNWYTY